MCVILDLNLRDTGVHNNQTVRFLVQISVQCIILRQQK
jgi:hypothetical protein